MTRTSQLLQDHSQYKATGVLVCSWLMQTSPHHLILLPRLYVWSALSVLNIKDTYLILWCEMTGVQLVIFCNLWGNGYSFTLSYSLENLVWNYNFNGVYTWIFTKVRKTYSWGALCRGTAWGADCPCMPGKWCVKWRPGICSRGVLLMTPSVQ